MKNLNELLKESILYEDSINLNDINKLDGILSNKSKLKRYIKSHEDEVTSMKLGSGDISDIINIIGYLHSYVISSAENDMLDDLNEFFNQEAENWVLDYLDGEDEDMIIPAIYLYKKLFEENTNKKI